MEVHDRCWRRDKDGCSKRKADKMQLGRQRQATMVYVSVRWQQANNDGGRVMTNNKTNESVHPQKAHPSSKGQNHAGGGATYHSLPRQIDPKPSAGGVVHDLCMTPVRLVELPQATGNGRDQSRWPP